MDLLVNVDVDDLTRAVAFYESALALSVGRRFGDQGVEMLGASSRIYLLAKPAGSRGAPGRDSARDYARHWTPVHLDFVVEDIQRAVERALAAGAVLEREVATHDWGCIAGFSDPFGHGFCLLKFSARGYDAFAVANPGDRG